MRGTDQSPFAADLIDAAQQELPEAARLFDLSKHGFDDGFATGIDGAACCGHQLAFHPVHRRVRLRYRPPRTRRRRLIVFLLPSRYIEIDFLERRLTPILLRTVTAIGQHLAHLLSRLPFHSIDYRQQLVLVVGLLCQGRRHDQAERRFYRDLRIVGLHEPIRPLHDPRLRIGEVMLRIGFRACVCTAA